MFNFIKKKPAPVVTGIGIISPIGEGVEQWWANLCANKSGISKISQFDASAFPCTAAAEVKDWQPAKYMPERFVRMLSRGAQFSLAALDFAQKDARLDWFEPYGTDVIIGAGASDFNAMEAEIARGKGFGNTFHSKQDSTFVFKTMMSSPASLLSYKAKTRGYVTTHVSACVSGLDAINDAGNRIMQAKAHTVIVGGVDTYISKIILQSFCLAGAVAPDNGESAEKAVKPFDLERKKSVLGEGACILILEEKKRAQRRNARIYCELIPGSQMMERTNIAFTHEKSGKTWAKVLQESAKKEKVDHINAHGPGDKLVDKIEITAFNQAFGEKLKDVNITSIKSTTGGGNAFASAAQIAAACKSIYEQEIPPTANYETPDPELTGAHPVKAKAKKVKLKTALVSAHGMGGMNAATVLRRCT